MVSLTLPSAYAAQMIAEARAANPAEACGLIAGLDGSPTKLYPIPNADPSIYRYNMDPKSQLVAMNDIEAQGWDLLAIWHSHTHTPAYPSPTDISLAYYPDSLYVILSLQEAEPAIRAFQIVDAEVIEVAVAIGA